MAFAAAFSSIGDCLPAITQIARVDTDSLHFAMDFANIILPFIWNEFGVFQ